MPTSRALRAAALAGALVVALSACEMHVQITTTIDEDGGGELSIGMMLDAEAVAGFALLAERAADVGEPVRLLEEITALFDCLERRGWRVARATPNGGLALTASRAFGTPAAFDRVLASLRCRERTDVQIAALGPTIDFGREGSFLKTRWFFRGRVDLRPPRSLDRKSREVLATLARGVADEFTLRIAAELPGSVSVDRGAGTVQEGRVVWEPRLGATLDFAASSSRLNLGAVLILVLPVALLVGAAARLAAGRRKPSLAEQDPFAEVAPDPSAPD